MDSSILIIGAGTAGLAAASELYRTGFNNVKVYEARDRTGGRIFSVRRNPQEPVVEFGAQWIHGKGENPVFKICEKAGLIDDTVDFMANFFQWTQIDKNKKNLATTLVRHCLGAVEKCEVLSLEKYRKTGECVAGSLYEFLKNSVASTVMQEAEDEESERTLWSLFEWFVRLQNELNGGEAEKVSANYLGESQEYEGMPTVQLGPSGYAAFLSLLLKDIPQDKIEFNVEVTKIDYTSLPLKITSSLGQEVFDFVICTIPLGVLKERKSDLFTPQLPNNKIRTIDSLGFGLCNKIFLEFDSREVFWHPGSVFQVLWTEDIPLSAKNWVHQITRFNSVTGHSNLLVAWVAGESSKAMEAASDEEVLKKCHETLSMILQRHVPKPTAIRRSSWYSDPYARGSYTYISTACDQGAPYSLLPSTLASPIEVNKKPVLCFAGEATSEHYFSTVHGAFDTGKREAERLASYVEKASRETCLMRK